MKRIHRIPTQEQFAFIECHLEADEILTDNGVEEAVIEYKRLTEAVKGGVGVPDKEMNMVVDCMLKGETVRDGIHIYERMSDPQKQTVQIIKRSLKRINKSNGVEDTD